MLCGMRSNTFIFNNRIYLKSVDLFVVYNYRTVLLVFFAFQTVDKNGGSTLRYGYETWPMSVKDEKRMATTEMRMV